MASWSRLLPNVFSICISRSGTAILAFFQHASPFTGVPMETVKNERVHASLIMLLQEVIHIELPECVGHLHLGSVDLKIGISNLVGASCCFSLCDPCVYNDTPVQLAVEYPSESSVPVRGGRGEPPPPTTVHWDFSGQPCSHAAPIQENSLV